MPASEGSSGVSNCYVFKSRLQEYAQKYKLQTPIYETIKEGPSHEPSFRSSVSVNGVQYDSLPGFFSRKAAEQSAAEIALLELAKCGEQNECVSQPVQETGLCKNMLQEYAQKMNYAIPLYQCRKDEAPGRMTRFLCTVEFGGIKYIGASARTKKEAEISAARTALLAIRSSSPESVERNEITRLTVLPCRKRATTETPNQASETTKIRKAKKPRFRKKISKVRLSGGKIPVHGNISGLGNADPHADYLSESKPSESEITGSKQTIAADEDDSPPLSTESSHNNHLTESNIRASNGEPNSCTTNGVTAEVNQEAKVDGDIGTDTMISNSSHGLVEASNFMTGFSQITSEHPSECKPSIVLNEKESAAQCSSS